MENKKWVPSQEENLGLITSVYESIKEELSKLQKETGCPDSFIFDFILIKIFGLNYVLFFSPALTILSVIQVLILRKIKLKFSRNILFLKKPEKNNLYKFFDNISFRSFYILIIRSLPILPHVLGSYIIASSKIKKKVILINTFLGSFFYYVFLYLIIGNV